jgi:hypothetical protein
MGSDSIAEKEMQRVYVLKGITYLPHYQGSTNNKFVSPAYGQSNWTEYSEMELLCLGATPTLEYLWRRTSTKRER